MAEAKFPAARQSAQALVSAGVAAHRTGDAALAQQFFESALEQQPEQPDALQLLGLLAKARGDLAGAEALMRRSLASDDRQAHVHANLANLLKGRGALEEALAHYRHAAGLRPDFVEALVQEGEALMALGRLDEAEAPLKKAQRMRPFELSPLLSRADWMVRAGDEDGAEKLLRGGLSAHPGNAYLLNNLGQLLCDRMRYQEALTVLAPLARAAPPRSQFFVNIGNCLVGLGRLDEAVAHYAKAIELDPLNLVAHDNINKQLWEMGRAAEVGQSYLHAKRLRPDSAEIFEASAQCLITYSFLDRAEADLLAAAKLRPDSLAQFRLWAELRQAQSRPHDAIAFADAGLQRFQGDLELLQKAAEACLWGGRPRDALEAARAMARIDPFNQFAAAYEASALRQLGEAEAASRLYDYERFVHQVDLAPPEPFADIASFHEALIPVLHNYHHASREPSYQSLRGGTQTHRNLFDRPGIEAPVKGLGERVMAAANAFISALPQDESHPFLARRGTAMAYSGSWSVLLGGGGFHVDHIHGKGWISGCYYVSVPPCLDDEEGKPGWIKFGEYRPPVGPALPWEKAVKPRPGLVVFFPSYMWHGTIPISDGMQRMTVAFDIAAAK